MKTIKKLHSATGSFPPIKAFGRRVLLALCAGWLALPAQANTLNWNGGGGANANWSSSANWGGVGTPANGDTIIFKGAANLLNTNNIANLTLSQIHFGGSSGFHLRGFPLTLTNSIAATNTAGANIIEIGITNATADVLLIVSNSTSLMMASNISGSVGVNKAGAGVLIYQCSGDNTYTGTTLVSEGTLQLNVSGASAFGGPLVIGDGTGNGSPTVQHLQSTEISDTAPITINKNGTLDLNNFFETISTSLTLNAGSIYTGTGTLTLSPNATITVTNNFGDSSSIYGNLNIGFTGTLTLQGSGEPLQLNGYPFLTVWANVSGSANIVQNCAASFFGCDWAGANSYTGNYVANGTSAVYLGNSLALGNPNNTLTINDQGQAAPGGNINLTNQSLTINGGNPGAAMFVDNGNGPCTNSWRTSFTFISAGVIGIPTNCLLNLIGPIGGSGGIAKNGPGTLELSGNTANTYAGTTTVTNGTMLLGKAAFTTAIPGPLFLNTNATVRLLNSFQLLYNGTIPVTMLDSSRFDLAGFEDWAGPISLQGAQITAGAGTLYLSGNITVNASTKAQSVISGNAIMYNQTCTISNTSPNFSPDLVFSANLSSQGSGGGLIKDGPGEVALTGSNSFTGPVTINEGNLWAVTSTALGNTNTPVTVNNDGELFLDGGVLNFGLKPLVLNGFGWSYDGSEPLGSLISQGACTWGGGITLASDSGISPNPGSSLSLTGAISGAGAFITYGPGTNIFSGSQANTYAGTTVVNGGTLVLNKSASVIAVPGNLVINNGGSTVRLANFLQTANTADVLVNSGALFDFSTFATYMDTLHGMGTVNFGVNGWIYVGLNNGSSEFDGSFTGIGYAPGWTVGKTGTGTFTLGGNSTYTAGITHVLAGKLFINSEYLSYIPVTVDAGATLGGTGSGVGDITANGIIAPGNPGNSPGIFTGGNVTFSASGNFTVALTGTNAGVGGYDQMDANGDLGSNTLANATLTVVPAFTSPVAIGQQFVILNGSGGFGPPCCIPPSDLIFGTFKGLPEGANFNVNGLGFQISYQNYDVTLTLTSLPPPPQLAGIQPLAGGSMQLNGSGITNLSYTVLAATNLPTTNWVSIGTATAPANTNALQFTDPNAASFNQRFYRFSWP